MSRYTQFSLRSQIELVLEKMKTGNSSLRKKNSPLVPKVGIEPTKEINGLERKNQWK